MHGTIGREVGLIMSQFSYWCVSTPGSIGGCNAGSRSLPPGSASLSGTSPFKTSRPVFRSRSMSMSARYLTQVATCVTSVQPKCHTARGSLEQAWRVPTGHVWQHAAGTAQLGVAGMTDGAVRFTTREEGQAGHAIFGLRSVIMMCHLASGLCLAPVPHSRIRVTVVEIHVLTSEAGCIRRHQVISRIAPAQGRDTIVPSNICIGVESMAMNFAAVTARRRDL